MSKSNYPFKLIQGSAPTLLSTGPYAILLRVLKARLTPTMTVEDASHMNMMELTSGIPTVEQFLADFQTLRNAGLDIRGQLGDIPEGIVLTDPELFMMRFPELAYAVPVMLEYEGVQPYTAGCPRIATPSPVTPKKPKLTLV